MRVQSFHPVQGAAKEVLGLFVRVADAEILPVFNDIGKIVIRCIAPVADIENRGAVGCAGAGSIHHLAKGAVFIAFPSQLDDEVGKAPVQDGVAGAYVSLIIVPGG